jgi:hypothetical protein
MYKNQPRLIALLKMWMEQGVVLFFCCLMALLICVCYWALRILSSMLFSDVVVEIVSQFQSVVCLLAIAAAGVISLACFFAWVLKKIRQVAPVCRKCRYLNRDDAIALHCAVHPDGPEGWHKCSDFRGRND